MGKGSLAGQRPWRLNVPRQKMPSWFLRLRPGEIDDGWLVEAAWRLTMDVSSWLSTVDRVSGPQVCSDRQSNRGRVRESTGRIPPGPCRPYHCRDRQTIRCPFSDSGPENPFLSTPEDSVGEI